MATPADQHLKCSLCGSSDFKVLFPAGVAQRNQIVRCRNCGLMYANPRSGPTDIEEIQAWSSFDVEKQAWFPMRRDKEQLQVADIGDTRAELRAAYPDRGRLLEIGSSLGYGLSAWQSDGWQVLGVEPWAEGAKLAAEKLGMETHCGQLRDLALPTGHFDVVVMLHVIEHVPDPLAEVAEVFRILKPGGRFVCETPRYDSLMFSLFGRRERSLSCDGHIYFFEVPTLTALGTKAGFETERVRLVGRSLTLARLLWNVGVISKSPTVKRAVDSLSAGLHLDKVKIHFNVKDMQRITFRKPSAVTTAGSTVQ